MRWGNGAAAASGPGPAPVLPNHVPAVYLGNEMHRHLTVRAVHGVRVLAGHLAAGNGAAGCQQRGVA